MKFVVLIDVTEASARLLKFAHGIAAAAGATLLVVHQSILPAPAMGDAESRSAVKNENKNEDRRITSPLKKIYYSAAHSNEDGK